MPILIFQKQTLAAWTVRMRVASSLQIAVCTRTYSYVRDDELISLISLIEDWSTMPSAVCCLGCRTGARWQDIANNSRTEQQQQTASRATTRLSTTHGRLKPPAQWRHLSQHTVFGDDVADIQLVPPTIIARQFRRGKERATAWFRWCPSSTCGLGYGNVNWWVCGQMGHDDELRCTPNDVRLTSAQTSKLSELSGRSAERTWHDSEQRISAGPWLPLCNNDLDTQRRAFDICQRLFDVVVALNHSLFQRHTVNNGMTVRIYSAFYVRLSWTRCWTIPVTRWAVAVVLTADLFAWYYCHIEVLKLRCIN